MIETVGREKLDFLAIQETKLSDLSDHFVRSVWDLDDYGFIAANAVGKAGGLLWVWNTSCFSLKQYVSGEGFLLISGELLSSHMSIILVNIYGP